MKRSALMTAVMLATLVAQDAEGFYVMGEDVHTDETPQGKSNQVPSIPRGLTIEE